ncbi:hypothetical protein DFJ73DRAFT_539898 [Zopfochytrium polystomum]|nr:hypothetical protein DFJ73DRAFT_539898 [Zopfochytrium polystomum]
MSDPACPRAFSRSIDASGYWTPLTEPPSSSLPSAMPTPDETAVKRAQASPEGTFKKTKITAAAPAATLDGGGGNNNNLFRAMAVSEGGTPFRMKNHELIRLPEMPGKEWTGQEVVGVLPFRPSSTATAPDEPRFETPVSTKEDVEVSTSGTRPTHSIPTLGESTAAIIGATARHSASTLSASARDGKGDGCDGDNDLFPKSSHYVLPAAPFDTSAIEKIAAYIDDDNDALEFLRHVDYMQRCADFEAEFATNVSACGKTVIENRSRAIHIMNEICVEQVFRRETFHSSIAFLDYFLSKTKYSGSEDLSVLAMTMVYIAAKLWEPLTPSVQELAANFDDPDDSLFHIRKLEYMFFKLSPCCVPVIPTVYDWFRLFMHNIRVSQEVVAPAMSTPSTPIMTPSTPIMTPSTTPTPPSPTPASPTLLRPATPTLKRMTSLVLTPTMMMAATTPPVGNQHFWSAQEQFYAQSGRHMCRTLKPSDLVLLMSFLDMLKSDGTYVDTPPSQLVAATLFAFFPRNVKDDRIAMALGIAKSGESKLFKEIEEYLAAYKQTVCIAEDESIDFFMQTIMEKPDAKDSDVLERKDDARPAPASSHLDFDSDDEVPRMEGYHDDDDNDDDDDDDVPGRPGHRTDVGHHRPGSRHLFVESDGEADLYDCGFINNAVVNHCGSRRYGHRVDDDAAVAAAAAATATEEECLTPTVDGEGEASRSPATLANARKRLLSLSPRGDDH